jgi:hypothetical protein
MCKCGCEKRERIRKTTSVHIGKARLDKHEKENSGGNSDLNWLG